MLELRTPTTDELPVASALCLASKAHWGYDAAFLKACAAELTLHPEDLITSQVVILTDADVMCGVCQIVVDGQEADLHKLFVAPDQMRRGYGHRLMTWAIQTARDLGATRLVIEADPGAVPFYLHVGARRIGDAPSGSIPGRTLPLLDLQL